MRIVWSMIAAALAMTPAVAEEPSVFDQYVSALIIFMGGDGVKYPSTYSALLDRVDGTWFAIGDMLPGTDDPSLFARACERRPITVAKRDGYSFNLVTGAGKDNTITTTYTSRSGNVFGSYTDPVEYEHWLGLDQPGTTPERRAGMLHIVNGLATVFQPTNDILVIQTNYEKPAIYARCAE